METFPYNFIPHIDRKGPSIAPKIEQMPCSRDDMTTGKAFLLSEGFDSTDVSVCKNSANLIDRYRL